MLYIAIFWLRDFGISVANKVSLGVVCGSTWEPREKPPDNPRALAAMVLCLAMPTVAA